MIATRWGEAFNRSSPLPEYPRPLLVRRDWLCLNGPWDYSIRQSGARPCVADEIPAQFDGQIIVPYAVECALSGVCKPLQPDETLWYRRRVSLPAAWAGRRVRLHFEAVDYLAAVFVDGVPLGTHRGGYLPFSFDLPDANPLPESGLANREIVVAVRDPGDTGLQQRGKQALNPAGILYTATSGIWQTVWLEPLPVANAICGVRVDAGPDLRSISLVVETGHPSAVAISIAMPDGGRLDVSGISGVPMYVDLPDPRLWTPADPYLYGLTAAIIDGSAVVDSVESYFALRTIDLSPTPDTVAGTAAGIGADGRPVIRLNGKPVFLNAVLDQGYWPESGMTPPADDALIFDIESMKALGFNGLRKHVKIESRRFYWHADRLGMLIIQGAVSGGKNRAAGNLKVAAAMILGVHMEDHSPRALRLAGRSYKTDRDEFEADLWSMVDLLRNHPSVVMWAVFNESWGQFESLRIAGDLRVRDPTRLVDAVSGWHDQGGGDFRSRHTYLVKLRSPPRGDRRLYFVSEFGGYNLAVPGHMWDESRRFGYKFYSHAADLLAGYEKLIYDQLIPLVRSGLCAAVYTQVSDVEIESNGFYTYDRKVLKIDAAAVRVLNAELYAVFSRAQVQGSRTITAAMDQVSE